VFGTSRATSRGTSNITTINTTWDKATAGDIAIINSTTSEVEGYDFDGARTVNIDGTEVNDVYIDGTLIWSKSAGTTSWETTAATSWTTSYTTSWTTTFNTSRETS
jgi:hypothetical protein